METPPQKTVGNVHVLPAGWSAKAISKHLTKSYLAFRSFYRVFSPRTQKTWYLARMKLAILGVFGRRQVKVKIGVWE